MLVAELGVSKGPLNTPGRAHLLAHSSQRDLGCLSNSRLLFLQVDFVVDMAALKHIVQLGKTQPQDLPPGPSSFTFEVTMHTGRTAC